MEQSESSLQFDERQQVNQANLSSADTTLVEQCVHESFLQADGRQQVNHAHLSTADTIPAEQSEQVDVDNEQPILPVNLQSASTSLMTQVDSGTLSDTGVVGDGIEVEHDKAKKTKKPEPKKAKKPEPKKSKKPEPKKPKRPCIFCGVLDSRLPRHILNKHKTLPQVLAIKKLSRKEQLHRIDLFRREGIKMHNMAEIQRGGSSFLRERRASNKGDQNVPLMCSGCSGFFSRTYAARHKRVCPALGNNFMIPIAGLDRIKLTKFNDMDEKFIDLLNGLRLDDAGNYLKGDQTILMIGARSFERLKKKKDKKVETKRTVRARMRILARLYLTFQPIYENQSEVSLPVRGDAGDMFHRDVMVILGKAINNICERKENLQNDDDDGIMSTDKNGLKIYIYNTLKLCGKFLIGYYLMKREDKSADEVVNFLKVLKYYEDDLFGDAYYALNNKKNVTSKKAISLPKEKDVDMIYKQCYTIIEKIDAYTYTGESEFVEVRTATCTPLMLFNARRGGEPPRLVISQWHEALNGDWIDEADRENDDADMLITYQTG